MTTLDPVALEKARDAGEAAYWESGSLRREAYDAAILAWEQHKVQHADGDELAKVKAAPQGWEIERALMQTERDYFKKKHEQFVAAEAECARLREALTVCKAYFVTQEHVHNTNYDRALAYRSRSMVNVCDAALAPPQAAKEGPCKRCNGTGWLEPLGPYDDGSYITSRPCPTCQR